MSTNKTTNYALHSWEKSDEFHVSEINENFAALDRALKNEAEALGARLQAEAADLNNALSAKAEGATVEALKSAVSGLQTAITSRPELVTGIYLGDNTTGRLIDLGRRPVAVIVEIRGGFRQGSSVTTGGMITEHLTLNGNAALADSGFTVSYTSGSGMNNTQNYYHYMALFLD